MASFADGNPPFRAEDETSTRVANVSRFPRPFPADDDVDGTIAKELHDDSMMTTMMEAAKAIGTEMATAIDFHPVESSGQLRLNSDCDIHSTRGAASPSVHRSSTFVPSPSSSVFEQYLHRIEPPVRDGERNGIAAPFQTVLENEIDPLSAEYRASHGASSISAQSVSPMTSVEFPSASGVFPASRRSGSSITQLPAFSADVGVVLDDVQGCEKARDARSGDARRFEGEYRRRQRRSGRWRRRASSIALDGGQSAGKVAFAGGAANGENHHHHHRRYHRHSHRLIETLFVVLGIFPIGFSVFAPSFVVDARRSRWPAKKQEVIQGQ